MIADETMPPWAAADEVYGRSGPLRTFLQDNGIGYVMRVGCAFHVELVAGATIRANQAVTTQLTSRSHQRRWQVCSVTGSKGERAYAWAWLATASPRHYLLIRKHLATGKLAYHYAYVPPGQPATLMTLVRVAFLRWPVEEGFEFGKDRFGLDHSQVRLHTALVRHIVLTLAALAVCAVTAAAAKT
jgi:SRSO17 transposase